MAVRYTSGAAVEITLSVVVLAILLMAEYLHNHKAATLGPMPTPIIKTVVVTAPGASVSPTPTVTPEPSVRPSFIYDASDLGAMFAAPGRLYDLTATSVHLAGDQAVNSIGLGSKRLDAADCKAITAPLGTLTYDTDKGGTAVATIGNRTLYYLDPKAGCAADATLLPLSELKAALTSFISDTRFNR